MNQFQSRVGRLRAYETEEDFIAKAEEYFKWVLDNPLREMQYKQKNGEPVPVYVDKMRPMTIDGLCIYLEIGRSTFNRYSAKDHPFRLVSEQIKAIIKNQKFEGAAAGFFNANIIAHDLGYHKDLSTDDKPSAHKLGITFVIEDASAT